MGKATTNTQTNICFDCENACGGCSWSRELKQPPKGATYSPVYRTIKHKNKPDEQVFVTYCITDCPLFEGSPNRRSVGMISEEENAKYESPHNSKMQRGPKRTAVR